jgi:vancomycin resistance protein YoaR
MEEAVYTISRMSRRVGNAGWTALFVGLGALAAWLALGGPRPAPRAPLVACSIAGKVLPPGDAAATVEAARAALQAWLGQSITMVVGEARPERTREQLGVRIDWSRLRRLVAEAEDGESALRRGRAHVSPRGPVELPIPYTVDFPVAMGELLQMKEEVDRAAVDARYDFKTKTVSPDVPGRRLDPWTTLARIDAALERGATAVEALVETDPARRTGAAMSGVSTDQVLGWFETQYARDAKHEARAYNLQVAASKLDGAVVMPDDTFDFNQVVGPRDEAHGYKVAPVIAQGALVDGMGGGTCQVAGTLHAAALFGGLDVVERRPHTRPSFYIKMGLDAAVAYPAVTLRLRNPYAFPVVLHESVQGGVVRAEVLGPARPRAVTFMRRIDEILPFLERDSPDASLPKGARELKQRGIPGFKITRWRVLRDGVFSVREHRTDYYPSTPQIWRVGRGPDDPKFEAHDDEHPEYVADEFLMMREGVDAKGEPLASAQHGGEIVESRVAGRSGTYGWTLREGLAKQMQGTRSRAPRPSQSPGGQAQPGREGID